MRRRSVLLVIVLALLSSACGPDHEDDAAVGTEPDAPAEWTEQRLELERGADSEVLLGADGGQTVVVTTTEEGAVVGYGNDEAGQFASDGQLETGVDYLSLGGLAHLDGDWFTLGSGGLSEDGEDLEFDIGVYRSSDGRVWTDAGATGIEGPADVSDLVVADGGLVAVGSSRSAQDPAMGGFRPVAWRSPDGVTWTPVSLPLGDAASGGAFAATVVGDRVVAVGQIGERGALWVSTDGGATWAFDEGAEVPDASSFTSIAAQGDVLVLTGTAPYRGEAAEAEGDDGRLMLRSTDGGQTWTGAASPPPSAGVDGGYGTVVTSGDGRFFTVVGTFVMSFDDPERCYADIELCRQDSSEVLYASADGDVWERVDTSGIGEGEDGEVWTISGAPDGPLVALTGRADGVVASTWPAGAPLPTEGEPVDPTTDVVVLGEDDPMETGVTYGVPLFIHCGMDWLYVGGEAWQRVDGGPDVETGAGDEIDPDWPVAQQEIFGFATLGEDGRIEYSVGDGEVIATYARTGVQPPGCD